MVFIYLTKIDAEKYEKKARAFLENIHGFYEAKGPLLRRRFVFTEINLPEIMEFIHGNVNSLSIPIQDIKSFRIERSNIENSPILRDYKKQIGSIEINRDCPLNISINATLNEVIDRLRRIEPTKHHERYLFYF